MRQSRTGRWLVFAAALALLAGQTAAATVLPTGDAALRAPWLVGVPRLVASPLVPVARLARCVEPSGSHLLLMASDRPRAPHGMASGAWPAASLGSTESGPPYTRWNWAPFPSNWAAAMRPVWGRPGIRGP